MKSLPVVGLVLFMLACSESTPTTHPLPTAGAAGTGAAQTSAGMGAGGLGGQGSGGVTSGAGAAAGGAAGAAGRDVGGNASGGNGGTSETRPNLLFILVDDLGYGDLSTYGNPDIVTKSIDQVAAQGTRFTQFYAGSPICSPSRSSFVTGMVPGRFRIHAELDDHASNVARHMADYLPLSAPFVARQFQAAGYATAHVGKWHLGGGRDVGDAPLPTEYGFDQSFTSFEGLGDRVLIEGHALSQQSAELGRGNITWAKKRDLAEIYVDHAIDFINAHQSQPFFLHLWLDDVHDPFDPKPELLEKYAAFAGDKYVQQFLAVLDNVDQQVGRLLAKLDELGLANGTLVVISGDNGPTAWPYYYNENEIPPGSTAGLRGRKWSLYEGGIREPLIVRWPGKIPAGKVNETSVLHAVDYLPTVSALAGVALPAAKLDGQDLSDVWLGADRARTGSLCWEYGHFGTLQPGLTNDKSPPLAIRDGNFKLLMQWDGSAPQLYDLAADPLEASNLAQARPNVRSQLVSSLSAFRNEVFPP